MAMEMSSELHICTKCGTKYSRRKGYFPTSYADLYKDTGYIPICRDCIDTLYASYLAQCKNSSLAVRQVCRKLDLYWSENAFNYVAKITTTRSMMTKYLSKLNTSAYAGKCYDNTLLEEGTIWNFDDNTAETEKVTLSENSEKVEEDKELENIPKGVILFWGPGYSSDQYMELEDRREYWMSKLDLSNPDVGTEAIIRQICMLELDINRDRIAGKSVEKLVTTLNNLLGSANLKPNQKKETIDGVTENTPFGLWIRKWEDQRPIPEIDPELEDVDGIKKHISIWFLGHLCKMLKIKNTYSKLYEEELAKMRLEKPEYEDEDDEALFNDIFGSDESKEGGNDKE